MKERHTKHAKLTAVALILLCGIALGALLTIGSQRLAPKADRSRDQASRTAVPPSRLQELLASASDRFAQLDIAVMNLLCAEGLPTDETVDVSTTLASLDTWARRVQSETERHFYKFCPCLWNKINA